jgi:hypothetical protein
MLQETKPQQVREEYASYKLLEIDGRPQYVKNSHVHAIITPGCAKIHSPPGDELNDF